MATVTDLAERVRRRLGVSLVPQSSRSAIGTTTSADVAAMVLRDRGIPVAEGLRPPALPPQSQAQVAASALRLNGIGQASAESLGIVSNAAVVNRALQIVGANPIKLTANYFSGTTVPITDIATDSLLKLSVYAAGEMASAPDADQANRVAVAVHESLVADQIAYWTTDAIPTGVSEHMVTMVANSLAPYFGRPASADSYETARQIIRVHALSGARAVDRAQVSLAAVHGDLTGRGLVDWTQATIPTGAFEAYATLVADRMAPVFEKARSLEQTMAAEMQIRLFAMSGPLGQALAQDRVAQVHDGMSVQGFVSWPVSAIPAAYVQDYAIMAAVLLSPSTGVVHSAQDRQVDQAAWDAANARVKRGAVVAGMQERALDKVKAVHSEMQGMGLVDWDVDEIPASMADAYTEAATALMGAESGELDPKAQQAAYQRIRMLAMNGPAGLALAQEKVRAVHYDLQARGRVQWTLLNIPRYAEEPYVMKAAYLLAPEIGLPADAASAEAVERGLMKIVAVPTTYRPAQVCYY